MTGKKTPEHYALDRLANLLVEDILEASDQEILAELQECNGDPECQAAEILALFEASIMETNKRRMAAAKRGVVKARKGRTVGGALVDIDEARKRLRSILAVPNASPDLTLAARNESELSDADILGMVDDLRELGVLPSDDDENGTP